ncbi:MAG: dihydrofolate reductase family protein [Gemmataceae bacterium]
MRAIRYGVAMSLDGYIAGPKGECDWIIMDPEIDFPQIFSRFDTFLMGRRAFEVAKARRGLMDGMDTVVVSRTLRPRDYPKITIISEDLEGQLTRLRAKPGKDIWLFGGGELFRSVLNLRLVHGVDVAVIPVLLGGGISMLPAPANQAKLRLVANKVYKTGIVALEYAIDYGPA